MGVCFKSLLQQLHYFMEITKYGISPSEEVSKLLGILGLAGNPITSLQINFGMEDIVTMTTTQHMTEENVKALSQWFENFLTPAPSGSKTIHYRLEPYVPRD